MREVNKYYLLFIQEQGVYENTALPIQYFIKNKATLKNRIY